VTKMGRTTQKREKGQGEKISLQSTLLHRPKGAYTGTADGLEKTTGKEKRE